jgi:hypothetical protein
MRHSTGQASQRDDAGVASLMPRHAFARIARAHAVRAVAGTRVMRARRSRGGWR